MQSKNILTWLKTGKTTSEFSTIKRAELRPLFMVAAGPSEVEKSCLLLRPGLKKEIPLLQEGVYFLEMTATLDSKAEM